MISSLSEVPFTYYNITSVSGKARGIYGELWRNSCGKQVSGVSTKTENWGGIGKLFLV
jgi:hypothetical protein